MAGGGPPPASRGASIAAYTDRDQVLLFGGHGDAAKTWLWRGQNWGLAQPANSPPARANAAMAYDPLTQRVLMFGGNSTARPHPGTRLNDTWEWDGCTWTRVAVDRTAPPAASAPAMTWDQGLNTMVLLTSGGAGAPNGTETWTWAGSHWEVAATGSASPSGTRFLMAFDPQLSAPIALTEGDVQAGAVTTKGTWFWDGTTWRRLTPIHAPPAPASAVLAVDPLAPAQHPDRGGDIPSPSARRDGV